MKKIVILSIFMSLALCHFSFADDKLGCWPTFEQFKKQMQDLQAKSDGMMKIEQIGKTAQGRPLLMAKLTDPNVSDKDKQVIIFSAPHGYGEASATGTALALIEWLVSDDPLAKETLKKQMVLIVPILNTDQWATRKGWGNANNVNLINDYHFDNTPPEQPETNALWKIFEKYHPDAFVSLHGMLEDYDASLLPRVWESTNIAYTSPYTRCYNRKVVDRVNTAAAEAGYPQDLGEEDMERILPLIPGSEDNSFPSMNQYATSVDFCYNRYHTLGMVMEIGPVRSGLARCKELLKIGNEKWEYECYPGYPNRIIMTGIIPRLMLTACGNTASERRLSRTLLWQNKRNFVVGMGKPRDAESFVGFITRVPGDWKILKTQPRTQGVLELISTKLNIPTTNTLGELADHPRRYPFFFYTDQWNVNRFKERPEGKGFKTKGFEPSLKSSSLNMPVSLRLRIDKASNVTKILLNDKPVTSYRYWQDSRYGYVEVDLEPKWQRAVLLVKYTPRPQAN